MTMVFHETSRLKIHLPLDANELRICHLVKRYVIALNVLLLTKLAYRRGFNEIIEEITLIFEKCIMEDYHIWEETQ